MRKLILILYISCFCTAFAAMAQQAVPEKQPLSRSLVSGKFVSNQITITDLYPNPSNGIIYADYTIQNTTREVKLSFYNVLGAVVADEVLPKNERHAKFDLGRLKPGIYFYTLTVDGQSQFTKRLVLKAS